ncbi:MAG TPA: AAA family ATPase [Stellaceae bacterium]|nr:AAA family ATPase [Stellaceae bacterium]
MDDAQRDDAQREVIAFLRDPSTYPPGAAPIEVIETHASLVFLAGRHAYKLKRAVKYPYLDFSTVALRRAACTAELRLNRRTAPQLYLEVRAISRGEGGGLVWGRPGGERPGAPEPVDFVVVMGRFAQSDLFVNLAQAGGLSAPLIYALAAHIAAFHDKAERRPDRGGGAALAAVAAGNVVCLRDCGEAGFAAAQIDRVDAGVRGELARVGALLDERRAAGKVRRGHGDLHLRNVCRIDGKPVLFDAIEFSEDLASIDVLYDLAFLLMDLDHRGHGGLANLLLNRYLDLTEEDDGLAAMPLFLALRAAIRAHVTATMARHGWGGDDRAAAYAEARRYLDEAAAALEPQPARLVAVGGRSGTGKSTLAAALAAALGRRPGARLLRSDVLRKLHLGAAPESPLPPEAYSPEITARIYHDLCRRAAAALRAGYAVVIDAVALLPEERGAFADAAVAAGVPFTGLWLEAPAAAMQARLAARRGDASDASGEVLRQQLSIDPGVLDWSRIDAGGEPAATLAAARRALLH